MANLFALPRSKFRTTSQLFLRSNRTAVPDETPTPSLDRWIRVAATCLVILTLLAGLAALTYLGPIIKPVLVAIFLYFLIKPAADSLVQRGISYWLAHIVLATVLLVALFLLGRVIYQGAAEFQQHLPEYRETLKAVLLWLPGFQEPHLEGKSLLEMVGVDDGDFFNHLFGTALSFTENVLMVFFYLIFIILDAQRMRERIKRAFPQRGENLVEVGERISASIASYMKVKTLVSAGMGISAAVIMWLLGLDNWQLWAFLTFLLNYITYVGSLAALAPPIVVSLLQLQNPWAVGALAVLLCVNRFVWIDYIEIRFSGKTLSINSVLLLASLAYWGWFWGVIGLVLAVPMLTAAKIVLANFERTRRWAILISED